MRPWPSVPERLNLRVAEHEGTVYIDTGRSDGQVIRIGQGRWAVTNTAPVRFQRTKLTGEMPLPPQGGDVARLWEFVNVAVEDRPVLLAVLVAALIQYDVPFDIRGVELSHHHGDCSFETILRRYELTDPVLWKIAEVIHEADLDDERYDAPEAPGLDIALRGLSMVCTDQQTRTHTTTVFDGLYEYYRRATLLGHEPA
ncbi:MAG: hypothetical protein QOI76_4073 [Frankiales bacterium]|nr:hypothetical protein [Frankiales bacterium]